MNLRFPAVAMLVAGCILAAVSSAAAAPSITQLSLRGLQIGGRTTIAVTGSDLLPDPRLLLSAPISHQSVRPGATETHVEFDVEIDSQAAPGIYFLRLAGPGGVSNGVAVGVDRLAQQPLAQRVEKLPVALTGSVTDAGVASVTFAGKKGDPVVVDVESRRLGSSLNPVVHVYDSRHAQLAWSQGIAAIAHDPRAELVLPADGQYTVELHDMVYRGAAPGYFRMKIGALKYVDMVYPLGVPRGSESRLTPLSTNLPSGTLLRIAPVRGEGPQLSSQPAPWPAGFDWVSGLRPRVIVSDDAEVVENRTGDEPQKLSQAPVAVNGRLAVRGERDLYELPVTPGQRLRIDVQAERMGSALDGILDVLDPAGKKIDSSDDRPGTRDPGLELVVPADMNKVTLRVTDLRGAGGELYVYRLEVKAVAQPDFRLALVTDRFLVPKDGVNFVRVLADRRGYSGPIRLTLFGLPENMLVTGAEIPAGATQTLVTLDGTGLSLTQRMVTIVGESVGAGPRMKRTAMVVENSVSRNQPWLRGEVAVAVAPPETLSIAWEPYAADTSLLAGSTLEAKVKIKRAAGVTGAVHLDLATSQTQPRKSITQGSPTTVNDVPRTLRLESNVVIGPEDDDATVKILVPGDLPWLAYDLVMRAEILGADGQSVVASAVTPARRLLARSPVKIELAGEPHVEARAGLGPAGIVAGKIVRDQGLSAPVRLALAGLPAGVSSPVVEVPADQDQFTFEIALPYGAPVGKLDGVRLVAVSQPDPNNFHTRVRSNELPLAMNVVAGEKPPAEQPMRVFEDEPEFIANLTQGGGDLLLATDERFSGSGSAKILMDQKFNPMLPGLNVKIRQKPGIGEYRYLQFAWRKQSGTACIQLAHDGKFGPTAGNPAPFRYHAGGGAECFGASLLVDRVPPHTFTLVTRDLFADFGEFTLTGLSLVANGELAFFDHIYLGKTASDFELVKP